jgi:hypothetical protein
MLATAIISSAEQKYSHSGASEIIFDALCGGFFKGVAHPVLNYLARRLLNWLQKQAPWFRLVNQAYSTPAQRLMNFYKYKYSEGKNTLVKCFFYELAGIHPVKSQRFPLNLEINSYHFVTL